MEYKLASDFWGKEEYDAIQKVIESGRFSMGKEVELLEEEFAKKFGVKYCVMSNSGSSANLLAVATLIFSKKLNKGDEVIVPAVSWSTTYHPLQQYGLKVKFVDIDLNTLNYDLNALRNSISSKTKMILVVNLLGNNNDFEIINDLCEKNNIIMMEDNCESMGSKYNGKYSGTFGVLGTFSSFYSHHIATMEGGYTVTNDENLYYLMKSLRAHGWTRGIKNGWDFYEKKENEFYEKFNFILPGYNLRPLEIEAALARTQIKKLDTIVENRVKNAKIFVELVKDIDGIIVQEEVGNSSWFGFSLVLVGKLKKQRISLVQFLESKGVETRPIVAGNFTRNECIKYYDYEIYGELKNADYIHNNGLFVGNNADDLSKEIRYLADLLKEFVGGLNEKK